MKKIKVKLIGTDEPSFFHNSRKDARTIAKAVNMLIDKVNELIDENDNLKKMINVLSTEGSDENTEGRV